MEKSSGTVLILIGSDSDLPVIKPTLETLKEFQIPFTIEVSSAHRSPARTHDLASKARENGFKVIIVGAGAAAHLAGVVASETILPVIGIPIDSSPLHGLDALYSTVMMPQGIPVATMAIGKAGAVNAAIFAVQVLSIEDKNLQEKLIAFKSKLAEAVETKSANLKKSLLE